MSNSSRFSTLIDLLHYRALTQPEQKAFTFLQNGEIEAGSLTYQELDQQARAIAVQLQKMGASQERVLLLYPTGLEFISAFWGCLYAGSVAIPAPMPDPIRMKRALPRLEALIKDARALFVLTPARNYSQLREMSLQFSEEFKTVNWIISDQIPYQLAQNWQQPDLNGDSLAYLQYTSGSTSTPKGVMVTHGNLMHHCAYLQEAWGYSPESVAATWVPHFHDYGLVDGLIQPLYVGIQCYLMSPVAFYMRPIRWLQAISQYRVTHSQGPNFAYEHCLNRSKPEEYRTLDLGSWQTASNGAEPIRPETIERFIATFEPYGFRQEALYPAYGMAEATLLIATKRHGEAPAVLTVLADALEKNRIVVSSIEQEKGVRSLVSCGPPIGEFKAVIANPETLTQCQPSEVGEIWVSDPSVTAGYWNRDEQTKQTFCAYLADSGEGPFLRTGDLGFLQEGELFITGRIKDVIIIRGRNHYPQDIELTVEKSHPALRPSHGAAFGLAIKGEERVIVVQEVERSYQRRLDVEEVVGNMREAVRDEHELQLYTVILIKAGSIPKTSSGKIQRSTCRSQFLAGTLDVLQPPKT
jgi:acyl-CoA synthetase (AMP-forming)/AMP-acid ligase II